MPAPVPRLCCCTAATSILECGTTSSLPLSQSFTIVRHDIRPSGRSAPSEKGFSSVEDLRALLDHLGIARASLVGLSLGGRIAIDFTLAYPDRVNKLVLMGPGLTGYQFKVENDQHMKRAIDRAAPEIRRGRWSCGWNIR